MPKFTPSRTETVAKQSYSPYGLTKAFALNRAYLKAISAYVILMCFVISVKAQTVPATLNPETTPAAPVTNPTTQSADDFVYDKTPITYDLTHGTYDKVLPFDRPFRIHFTEIPTSVTFINVIIRKDNANSFRHAKPGDYSEKDLTKFRVSFTLHKWERPNSPDGAALTTADVYCPISLLPNTSYSIDIQTGYNAALTKFQQDDLISKLPTNVQVTGAISALAHTALTSSFGADEAINKENSEMQAALTAAVKSVNPKYDLSGIDLKKSTVNFTALLTAIDPITDDLNKIIEKTISKPDAKKIATDLLKSLQLSFNWAGFVKDDVDYKEVIKSLADIQTASAGLTDLSIIKNKSDDLKSKLDAVIPARDALVSGIIKDVVVPMTTLISAPNDTYVDNFLKNAKLYVSLDMGLAYVWRIDRGLAYSGFNIYFRPINKSIPLHQYNASLDQWLAVRSSLLIGVTLGSVAETNVRKGFIGDQGLVFGYGLKLVSFFKLNAGTMVNYRYDTNPLFSTNRYHTSLSPFVSFSIDLDAKALLSGIGDSIFK